MSRTRSDGDPETRIPTWKKGTPKPCLAHKVKYTEAGKKPWSLEPDMLTSDVTRERVAKFIEDHHDDLFFLKARDWHGEYEYRFVVTAPPDLDGHFVDFGDSLRCVVAGEKFPDWQIAGALDLATARDADALRLGWDNEPYLTALRPDSDRPW